MTATLTRDIVLRLDSLEQLFNEPDMNPFSEEEVDVLGEPALLRAVRRLLSRRIRNWEGMPRVIELPKDHIAAGLEQQIVIVISILVIILTYFLLTSVFPRTSDTVTALIASSVSVFVWVSLWGPLEKLLFDWVQPHMENRILRKLLALEVVIRPKY